MLAPVSSRLHGLGALFGDLVALALRGTGNFARQYGGRESRIEVVRRKSSVI